MEFAVRLFFIVFADIVKRLWFVMFVPMALITVHGLYTGSWYILTGIITSFVVALVLTIYSMNKW